MLSEEDKAMIANLRGRIKRQHRQALKVLNWLERYPGLDRKTQDQEAAKKRERSLRAVITAGLERPETRDGMSTN